MRSRAGKKGTVNVLADLGFEDAEDLTAKVLLAVKLNELIETRGLSQAAAAEITGMTQPKVSQIRRYKLQNISLERLMQALVSFDQQVEITVKPARTASAAGITVAAGLERAGSGAVRTPPPAGLKKLLGINRGKALAPSTDEIMVLLRGYDRDAKDPGFAPPGRKATRRR